ncbi:MAG: hypothetical protein Q9165_000065 [Trypethelium subeluteriae]
MDVRLLVALLLATATSAGPSYAIQHIRERQESGPVASSTQIAPANPTSPISADVTNGPDSEYLYGVNIGGWLVLEKWMNSDVFENTTAYDQWTFDSRTDVDPVPLLEQHWSSWFTEQDVIQIKNWGFNAMRIPIGFWAFETLGSPYKMGAQIYLDKAIEWARTHGLKVWVDHHGVPGSQNGFENSGHNGSVEWQNAPNYQNSIDVLVTMAKKYGSIDYADVVNGIELVNEPISWKLSNGEGNDLDKMQAWTKQAYTAVKNVTSNPDLRIIMHDAFAKPFVWTELGAAINGKVTLQTSPFAIDTHLYQDQVASDSTLTNAQHIAKACNYSSSNLLPQNSTQNLPVYVGEFSLAIKICVNPDGTTTAGSTCSTSGCQCASSHSPSQYKSYTKAAIRQFAEAQLLTYEKSAQGFFIWAYKAPGGWGLVNAMAAETLPNPINDLSNYQYPNICQDQ